MCFQIDLNNRVFTYEHLDLMRKKLFQKRQLSLAFCREILGLTVLYCGNYFITLFGYYYKSLSFRKSVMIGFLMFFRDKYLKCSFWVGQMCLCGILVDLPKFTIPQFSSQWPWIVFVLSVTQNLRHVTEWLCTFSRPHVRNTIHPRLVNVALGTNPSHTAKL